ncbi:MAG: hypothetical protein QOG10_140 [Kribbellaceae bacterium]|jgi:hypothetical protein|nr:hypothetical protein [Kribbellaceae bacterium]
MIHDGVAVQLTLIAGDPESIPECRHEAIHADSGAEYERTERFRIYEHHAIPGLGSIVS